MGFVRHADYGIQENMERHLVEDLKTLGYDAVSSFQKFGPKAFEGLTEIEAVQSLRENGFDAVLTIVLLDKEKEKNYYHGYFYYTPFTYYYGNFWGYRMMMYDRIYQPGYYVTTTRYFWESNFYDLRSKELLYSVQTKSFKKGDDHAPFVAVEATSYRTLFSKAPPLRRMIRRQVEQHEYIALSEDELKTLMTILLY